MMGYIEFLRDYYFHLSNNTISLKSVLSEIYTYYNLQAIEIRLDDVDGDLNKSISIGLAEEQCEFIAKKFDEVGITEFDNNLEIRAIDNLDPVSFNEIKQTISGVLYIYILRNKGIIDAEFFLYSDRILEFDDIAISHLYNGLGIIKNWYSLTDQLELTRNQYTNDMVLFDHGPLPMIITNSQFKIIKLNHESEKIFPQIREKQSIWDFILDQKTPIKDQITKLKIGETLTIENIALNPNLSNRESVNHLVGTLIIKLITIEDRIYYILNYHPLDAGKKIKLQESLHSTEISLHDQLKSYAMLYQNSTEEAIEYGLSKYFPAAIAFTINEQSGPMILTSSPEIDENMIYEESVKLLAGLNTKQILENGYITGSTPWNYPQGELRWIAFYLDNPNARGDVEVHTIGIITTSNLLAMKPQMTNTFLGLQLSTINQYKEIIMGDNADFVTKPYNQDRNFSTVSIIQDILLELRKGCSELLAVYSSE